MARLRRPPGAWRLVDDVGADRMGVHPVRCVSSVQTESAIQSPWAVTEAQSLPTFYS